MADLVVPYGYWQREILVPHSVDCLLPSGMYIALSTDASVTLANLKTALWKEAQKLALFHLLRKCSDYVFVGVTSNPPYLQEFYDESRSIRELRLFLPILKLKEAADSGEEQRTCQQISEVCAISVADFEKWTDPEQIGYRLDLLSIAKATVDLRNKGGQKAVAAYFYPSQLETDETFQKDLRNNLEGDVEFILISPYTKKQSTVKIHVTYDDMPSTVVFRYLQAATHLFIDPDNPVDIRTFAEKNYENYVLKVCGRESYFLKSQPFIQYKFIRNKLVHKLPIKLTLVSRDELYASLDTTPMSFPVMIKKPSVPLPSNATTIWDCERKFRVRPTGIMKLHSGSTEKIFVRIGMYHGTESLCPWVETPPALVSNPQWTEWLTLDILVRNIPRSAKLCVCVCAIVGRGRRDRGVDQQLPTSSSASPARSASLSRASRPGLDHIGLTWANINMFNSCGELLNKRATVAMWPTGRDVVQTVNPCGQPGTNPNKENAGHLTLNFDPISIVYPPHSTIVDFAEAANKLELDRLIRDSAAELEDLNTLRALAKRDPLYEPTEQEKELLWRNRYMCRQVPEVLPKLLSAVKWSSRDEVSELYAILARWPLVPNVVALELMDCKYPDLEVRNFAIRSLDRGCLDTELEHYVLQLVQVFKYDVYLESPVGSFLLKRGVHNRRIGHVLFWLLKAEMHDPTINVRFGCLLEALCRGSGAYIKALGREVIALGKLKDLSELVVRGDENQRFVIEQLQLEENCSSLDQLPSPLDCDDTLGELKSSLCNVLSSAKRPLWLVWSNPDPLADMYYKQHVIIFKNGDDLRQDMLTLQVIGLMDNIWQTDNLNLRMIPYGCLPTGKNLGVIEVVRNSRTVMSIQKKIGGVIGTMQTDSTCLLKWLRTTNTMPSALEQAIENFTHSCAGYCVATFILGIGDRHPDNIMLTEGGQLFHIDFGHFLGHYKKKFGINRERVPFVLPGDFIYVIARGADNPKQTAEYRRFVELCCRAYGIMRRHANLIITLFTMMLCTGIAELQTFEDVAFLRNTLAVDKSEPEAMAFFREKIEEASGGAWTTKLDWAFHGVKHM
ncbi:Phosphatidylinositol [Hypsibius exemplaris]|uniref:Phosphatidylinositol n=1 Tax=Hypsibius exemplaris TaxID=2072580 RepID=A0A1W0WFZ9_HYPEX|nr:Phosphatidylinositol [Hypsibius exemplaris]